MSTNSKKYHNVDLDNYNALVFLLSIGFSLNTPLFLSTKLTDKDHLQSCFFNLSVSGSFGSPPLQLKTQRTKASMDIQSSIVSLDPAWFRVRVEGSEDLSSRDKFD